MEREGDDTIEKAKDSAMETDVAQLGSSYFEEEMMDILRAAAREGSEEMVTSLLDRVEVRVPLTAKAKGNVLLAASYAGHVGVMATLIGRGADPNSTTKCRMLSKCSLHHAASCGSVAGVQLLIASGVRPDVGDRFGKTALMYAAEHRHGDVVRALIAGGAVATTSLRTLDMRTALHYAATSGCVESIRALLAHDAAVVDARTSRQGTPLMAAAEHGRAEAVRVLLAHGADVNAACEGVGTEMTALHYAAAGGYAECVEVLLASGADVTAVDVSGQNALARAASKGHHDVVRMLTAVDGT